MNLAQFRQAYPEYDDLPDGDLVNSLHDVHYIDIPLNQFHEHLGYSPESTEADRECRCTALQAQAQA